MTQKMIRWSMAAALMISSISSQNLQAKQSNPVSEVTLSTTDFLDLPNRYRLIDYVSSANKHLKIKIAKPKGPLFINLNHYQSFQYKMGKFEGAHILLTLDENGKVITKETSQEIELSEQAQLFEFNEFIYIFDANNSDRGEANKFTLSKFSLNGDFIEKREISSLHENTYKVVKYSFLNYVISPDQSKILLYYKLPETRAPEGHLVQHFRFMVFDDKMNLIWEKDQAYDHHNDKSMVGNHEWLVHHHPSPPFFLSNTGAVISWTNNREKKEFNSTSIYITQADETLVRKIDHLSSDHFKIMNEGSNIYLINFMNDVVGRKNEASRKVIGISLITLNPQLNYEAFVDYFPFEAAYFQKNIYSKISKTALEEEQNNKNVSIMDLVMMDVQIMEDESLLISGTQKIKILRQQKSGAYFTTYFNQNLLLFNVKPNTGIQWNYNIPFIQKDNVDMGAIMKIHKNKIYVMFNDNIQHFSPTWDNTSNLRYTGKNNEIALVVVDPENLENAQKRINIGNKKEHGFILPEFYFSEKDQSWGYFFHFNKLASKTKLTRFDLH